MASGDTLFKFFPADNEPTSSNYATLDQIVAVTGLRPCLDFIGSGGSADEVAIFSDAWPSYYDGGGINVTIAYAPDGTATGAMQFEVSIEKTADGSDLDSTGGADFGTLTDITDTPTGTKDQEHVTAAGAISHANCGSPAAGNGMRLKVARDHDHATNTDDAQLLRVVVTEQ